MSWREISRPHQLLWLLIIFQAVVLLFLKLIGQGYFWSLYFLAGYVWNLALRSQDLKNKSSDYHYRFSFIKVFYSLDSLLSRRFSMVTDSTRFLLSSSIFSFTACAVTENPLALLGLAGSFVLEIVNGVLDQGWPEGARFVLHSFIQDFKKMFKRHRPE